MMRTWLIGMACLAAVGCGEALGGGQCAERPIHCDDVPPDFHLDPACGTTVCGGWERCTCVEGEWQTTYIDCFGCIDAAPIDAAPIDANSSDAGADDAGADAAP